MKSETFNINDLKNILVVPRPTIVSRINKFGFRPIELRKHRNRTRYYYSKEQLEKLKEYFTSDMYIPEPLKYEDLLVGYEIDEDKNCIITMHSKMNFNKCT